MSKKHMPVQEKRYEVERYALKGWGETLPVHVDDAGITHLHIILTRIRMFRHMAEMAQTESDMNLFTALRDDLHNMFYSSLYAQDSLSDKIAQRDAYISELEARLNINFADLADVG